MNTRPISSKRADRTKLLFAILTLWHVSIPLFAAEAILVTGFESPEFNLGSFGTGNGGETQSPAWSLLWFGPVPDILNLVRVQSTVVRSGMQALAVQSEFQNSAQRGFFTVREHSAEIVKIGADVRLASATSQTTWQFGVGDYSAEGGFVGGFNIASDDGRLQQFTAGFPDTGPIVRRDMWYRFDLVFDLPKQTYSISVDGVVIAPRLAFLAPTSKLRIFQFDTFASGNDVAYFDNFSFTGSRAAHLRPIRRTGQQCRVEITGDPGTTGTLERSPDLVAWSQIATISIPGSGVTEFADSSVTSPSAFYRFRY